MYSGTNIRFQNVRIVLKVFYIAIYIQLNFYTHTS